MQIHLYFLTMETFNWVSEHLQFNTQSSSVWIMIEKHLWDSLIIFQGTWSWLNHPRTRVHYQTFSNHAKLHVIGIMTKEMTLR